MQRTTAVHARKSREGWLQVLAHPEATPALQALRLLLEPLQLLLQLLPLLCAWLPCM